MFLTMHSNVTIKNLVVVSDRSGLSGGVEAAHNCDEAYRTDPSPITFRGRNNTGWMLYCDTQHL